MNLKLKILQSGLLMLVLTGSVATLHAAKLNDYGAITHSKGLVQRPGAMVWMDLLTGDVGAASSFYSSVFGWDFQTSPDGEYAYATLNGRPVASIVAYDDDVGEAEGLWLPSISVPDVDQAVRVVKSGGGAIIDPPEDLPGRGRYVLVEDPGGAVVMLLRASTGDPEPVEAVNDWYWGELWTDDMGTAAGFYEAVVGYRTVPVKDMEGNTYKVFGRDQTPYASVVKTPLPDVEPNWLAYLLVDSVDDTARRVLKAGGAVLIPPQKDGFNSDVAIVADPTGGVFALQQKEDK